MRAVADLRFDRKGYKNMKIPTHYNVDSVKSVCFFALNHDVLSLCHLKLCNVCDIVFDKMQRVFA